MHRTIILGACTAAAVLAFGVQAQAQRRPQIILFQEDNFRGNQLAVSGPIPRLAAQHFEDRASSVRVISGSWELCDKDEFGGRCITVDRDIAKLDTRSMDDRTSSIRPVEDQPAAPTRRRR